MTKIQRVSASEPVAQSADPVTANLDALRALLPQAFTEGRVDFEVLRELLGDAVLDEGEERYGLSWSGKARARRHALTPTLATLRPAPDDSVDWDATKNIVIEGDNLEVLKCLQKSYAGKVKLVYIDPPYNTGNDFVYPDDYAEPLRNYLRRTGQTDDEGVRNTSNPEASGRFHADWLNMIYPRLMLAREMLSKDGLITISCDDSEVSRLSIICDAIFGEDTHLATIVWQKRYVSNVTAQHLSDMHDFVLVYARDPEMVEVADWERREEQLEAYRNPDHDPRGLWRAQDLSASKFYAAGRFEIVGPKGGRFLPPPSRYWRCNEAQFQAWEADSRIWWGIDGAARPMLKSFLGESERGIKPNTWWDYRFAGHNKESTLELKGLFDGSSPFDNPKPVKLIRRLLDAFCGPNDLILDFFAGSGTTGHAVMAQNAADNGNRRYILVQLPEPLDPANKNQKTAADFCDSLGKPRTIAELTKERLRRAGAKVQADNPEARIDTDFRVYKLDSSNLKVWQPGADIEADLLDAADNLVPGRTEDDLLVELLLKRGIDLCEPVQTREIAGRAVHAFGGGVLVVSLAPVAAADAEALAQGIADWVIELDPVAPALMFFRDTGFENDLAKLNLEAILRQRLHDRGPDLPKLLEKNGVRSL